MNMVIKNVGMIIDAIVLIASLLAIIFTFGVVWRVEKKMDLSYKLFLISILSFTASEIVPFLNPLGDFWLTLAADLFKMLFALLFLAGVWMMRNMIRRLDGEKPGQPE